MRRDRGGERGGGRVAKGTRVRSMERDKGKGRGRNGVKVGV